MDFNPAIQDAAAGGGLAASDTPATSRGCGEGAEVLSAIDKVGGGNPKVCYINYKIRTYCDTHDCVTKAMVEQLRQSAAAEYDGSRPGGR